MTMKSVDPAHLRSVVLAGHAGGGKTTLAEQLLFRAGADPAARPGRRRDRPPRLRARGAEAQGVAEPRGRDVRARRDPDHPGRHARLPGLRRRGDLGLRGRGRRPVRRWTRRAAIEAGLETAVALGRSTGRAACFFLNKLRPRERATRQPRSTPSASGSATRSRRSTWRSARPSRSAATSTSSTARPTRSRAARRSRSRSRTSSPTRSPRRRDQLLEAAAEADDDVMAKYLEGEEISDAELDTCLHRGVRDSILAPVLVGSAAKGIGMNALLDAFIRYLPDRRRGAAGRGHATRSGNAVTITPDPTGPLVARVVQDRRRPVRRAPDLPPDPERHAPRPGPRLERRTATRTSGSASCSCSTARSRSRSASSRPARSAPSPSSPRPRPATRSRRATQPLILPPLDFPRAVAVGRDRAADEGRPRQDGRGPPADARGGAVGPGRAHRRPASSSSSRWATPTSRSSASG